MAIMKTLTVGSETYTVRDPEAVSFEQPQALTSVQQQTARGNIGATSMREAVDKLCPRFDESGPVVICEPVAGYPLEVVSRINKNPNLLTDIWDANKWTEDPMGFMIYETDLPSGEYIIYAEFDSSLPFMVHNCDEEGRWNGFELHSGIPKTFTHSGGVLRITDEYLIFKKVTSFYLGEYTAFASVKLTQKNGTDTRVFTVDLGQALLDGSFNWTTGVLTDHNGNTHQLPAQEIPALPGVNTLYSDRGDTAVAGAGAHMTADDTAVSANPWSSKNTVDKLCPTFTESGAVVACEPVEGYPLEVEWETKNLVVYPYTDTTKTVNGITFTDNGDGSITINGTATANATFLLRNYAPWAVKLGESYTAKLHVASGTYAGGKPAWAVNYYPIVGGAYEGWMWADVDRADTDTCLINGNNIASYIVILAGTTVDNLVVRPQLEKGTTATAYEPYAETATITRCGKNQFGSVLEYGLWSFSAKRKNENTNYVRTADLIPIKPGATYRLSGTASQSWQGNMGFYDKDGAYLGDNTQIFTFFKFTVPQGAYYMAFHMPATYSGMSVDINGTVQMEFGDTATEYEPFKEAETFAPGEPVTAITGVNTIYADKGKVTVTGRANPSAIIEKLTNAIISLGGNV